MRKPLISALPVLVLLSACSGYGPWRTLDEKGPRIAGGSEATIQERCAGPQPMSDVIRCETVVLDARGNRVPMAPHMEELERYLSSIAQIAPWMTTPTGPNKGPGPYKLYLISVLPSIVVAVPERSNTDWYCWDSPLKKGCLPSSVLNLNSYWFRAPPKIEEGSFWFSPEAVGGAVMIDTRQPVVQIKISNAEVRLVANNGRWVVEPAR